MSRLLAIAINQLGALLIGLAGVKLLSHYVPPSVNWIYQSFLTMAQLAVLLTHPGLLNHASRYWHRETTRSSQYARFLWVRTWTTLKYLVPIICIACAVLAVTQHRPFWFLAILLLLLSNWAIATNAVASMALNASERHWALCWINIVGAAARTGLPLGAVIVFGPDILALAGGFAAHAVIVLGLVVFLFSPSIRSSNPPVEVELQWRRELRNYGRPFFWLGLGGWLLQFADRWVVAYFFGEEQAGLFALAAGLGAYVPNLILAALMQGMFPKFFRDADLAKSPAEWQALARRSDQFTLLFLAGSVVGLLGLQWGAPHLVGWLIDPRYERAMGMILAAGLAAVTVQSNQFQYLLLQGQHNSTGMVKVMLAVAGIKTLGSVVAASISWSVFLAWLMLSVVISAGLGRHLIRAAALNSRAVGTVRDN